MSANPLLKGGKSSIPDDRNPLTDPVIARRWAQDARARGKPDLAAQWENYAREIEG